MWGDKQEGSSHSRGMIGFIAPRSMRTTVESKLNRLTARAHTTWVRHEGTSLVIRKGMVTEHDRYELGDIPVFEGHTFIARIEHTTAGNLIVGVPGRDLPEGHNFREAKPVCDHCGTKRMRRDTIVMDVNGETKQIGRSCLAKYMPVDPACIVAQAKLLSWLNDEVLKNDNWDTSGSRPFVPTEGFLACVVASHEEFGFSRTNSERSTKANAFWRLHPCTSRDADLKKAWHAAQPTEAQEAKALLVLEWAKTLEGDSDYEHNLRVASNLPDVGRNAGILASVVQAYDRAMGQLQERVQREAQPDAGHFGQVKERVEITATLKFRLFIENDFGGKVMHKFETAEGHQLVWFCSGEAPEAGIGDTLIMKATIKSHEDYKGRAQTLLTRCKTLSVVSSEALSA